MGKAIFRNRAGITSASAIAILVVAVSLAGTVLVLNSGLLVPNKGPSKVENRKQPLLSINGTTPSDPKTPPINDQNDSLKVEPDHQPTNTNVPTIVEDNSTKQPTNYTLTVEPPEGAGSSTPETGNHTYVQGAIVQVDAASSPNWVFNFWLLDGSRDYSRTIMILMNASHSLKPVFSAIRYNLTISVDGSGYTNPESGTYTYINGTRISLNAIASEGWKFDHWVLGDRSWTDNPTALNLTQNYGLLAVFTQLVIQSLPPSPPPSPPSPPPSPPSPPVSVALTIQAPDGSGSTSPATGSHLYSRGVSVQVTAAPSTGWQFDHWILDGSGVGSTNPIIVTMSAVHALEAVFTQIQYSIMVATSGQGSVAKNPGQVSYASGSTVQLTATPVAGWSFSGWSGDLSGSTNPSTIVMNAAKTVTASFTQNMYTLTVTTTPSTGGTVTLDKSPPYHLNDVVVLTETPSVGYTLSSWSGAGTGSGTSRTVTVTGNMTVTAAFTQTQFTLSMSTSDQGSVTKNPSQTSYTYGSTVQLTATPASGWTFTGWGGDLSGSVNPAILTVNGNKAVTATFTQNQYTLTASTSGQGAVAKNPNQATYSLGSSVQLTAIPTVGWIFTSWSGDLSGSANPATVTVNGNKAVTATFTQVQYTISTSAGTGGSLSPSGSVSVVQGSSQILNITPSTDYQVSSVLVDGVSVGIVSSYTFSNVQADHTISASFARTQFTITASAGSGGSISPSGGVILGYGSGQTFTITANTGYHVTGVLVDGVSVGAVSIYTFSNMQAAHTISATFTQLTFTLIVTVNPSSAAGTVTPNSSPPYHYGDVITLIESPSTGYTFSTWSGDGTGTGSTRSVTVTGNITVTATFVKRFIETCDTFDSSIWGYTWNAPTVSGGEWVFNVPAGSTKNIQAVSKAANFGYGNYSVTFRMSNMVSGVNWSFFLLLDQRSSGGAYNELDIPEVTPGAVPPNHISTYEGTLATYQVDYFATPSPAYDDGNVHTMTWNWQRNYIDFYVDGVMIRFDSTDTIHSIQRVNSIPGKNPFPIADPPMALYLGVFPGGTQTSPFTLYISQIEYQPS